MSLSKLRKAFDGLSSLQQRAVTALILAPLFFFVLWFGSWVFAFVIMIMALLCYREWLPMVQTSWPNALEYTAYGGLALSIMLTQASSFKVGIMILIISFLIIAALSHLYIDKGDRRAPPWLCFGILYVGLPFMALIWLRKNGFQFSVNLPWAATALVFFHVWATDTFAYFSGRTIGGPKIAPKISPSKTWAGLVGGMVGGAIVMGGFAYFWNFEYALAYVAFGAILAVVAQVGDFFESYVKRRAGIKDSGTIIPGHGGILDRVDGLLASAPVFILLILALL